MKYRHFVITRFNTESPATGVALYDTPVADEWMDQRMVFFRETKRSVLSQDADFKWIICLDERTPQRYLDEIFTDDRMILTNNQPKQALKDIEIDTPWVITSRIDNDDQYLHGALREVQNRFLPQLMTIDLHYDQVIWGTGQRYTNGNKKKGERFRKDNNGPFLSLIEPVEDVKTVFCRPHTNLPYGYPFPDGNKEIPNLKVFEQSCGKAEAFALMVIHGNNLANHITGYKI